MRLVTWTFTVEQWNKFTDEVKQDFLDCAYDTSRAGDLFKLRVPEKLHDARIELQKSRDESPSLDRIRDRCERAVIEAAGEWADAYYETHLESKQYRDAKHKLGDAVLELRAEASK